MGDAGAAGGAARSSAPFPAAAEPVACSTRRPCACTHGGGCPLGSRAVARPLRPLESHSSALGPLQGAAQAREVPYPHPRRHRAEPSRLPVARRAAPGRQCHRRRRRHRTRRRTAPLRAARAAAERQPHRRRGRRRASSSALGAGRRWHSHAAAAAAPARARVQPDAGRGGGGTGARTTALCPDVHRPRGEPLQRGRGGRATCRDLYPRPAPCTRSPLRLPFISPFPPRTSTSPPIDLSLISP